MVCQAFIKRIPGCDLDRLSVAESGKLSFLEALFSVSTLRRCLRVLVPLSASLLLVTSGGCNSLNLGAGRTVQELRSENERLLAEFRAERDRRQQTEEQLRRMESRLAESEKLIARQYSSSGQRLSQLSGSPNANKRDSAFPQYRGNAGQDSAAAKSDNFDSIDPDSGLRWQRRSAPQ